MAKSVERLLALLEDDERSALVAGEPSFQPPMLALDAQRIFSDDDWLFERKLDGLRCVAVRIGGNTHLYNRSGELLDQTFPEIHAALDRLPSDTVVDGEIVALEGKRTRYSLLQPYLDGTAGQPPEPPPGSGRPPGRLPKPAPCWFYLFDLLQLGSYDLRAMPLLARKMLLRNLARYSRPLRFTDHRRGDGEHLFEVACRKSWEGVVAKRAGSRYSSERSGDWLKVKCQQQQELVIGGYTSPNGSPGDFGELLIGFFERGRLRYAGKVGTGFDQDNLSYLKRILDQHRQPQSPFDDRVPEKNCHWLAPELVCEVAFTAWTRDLKLRQPRYLGLRHDKNPREVVREATGEAA